MVVEWSGALCHGTGGPWFKSHTQPSVDFAKWIVKIEEKGMQLRAGAHMCKQVEFPPLSLLGRNLAMGLAKLFAKKLLSFLSKAWTLKKT